jgi:hypothetical protein
LEADRVSIEGSELSGLGSVLTAAGDDSPGAGPPVVAATLRATYAAGAGDPIADDLMVMTNGNMRFQSTVDSNPLPVLGYFQAAAAQSEAASGFPCELWSLAIDVAGGAFGRRFAVYQMFDPNWDGTFTAINGKSWETERVTFTTDGGNEYKSQNQNPAFGSRDWKIFSHYCPVSYPQGSSVNGTVMHETGLYNTIDLGLRLVDQLDGWGQTNRELTPQSNGITWQWASHFNTVNIAGAANDGIGWAIYSGDLAHTNHLQAGIAAEQVTGDPLGDWYWALYVSDTLGGLAKVADFGRTAINFYAPTTFTSSVSFPASVAEPVVAYRSALIDLTVVQDNIPLNIPQRPGFIYIVKQATLHIHDGAGTATTNLTVSIGNNASHDNEASSAIAPASLNPLIGRIPAYAVISVAAAQLIDSNTLIVAKVSTVAAGVTSLHGYLAVTGLWVPA